MCRMPHGGQCFGNSIVTDATDDASKALREVNADEILDALETVSHEVDANWGSESIASLFRDPEVEKLMQKGNTGLDKLETDSAMARRYAQMSFFGKMQVWLQSHKYEIVIAAVLCINVLWMAFELQLSGSDTGYQIGVISAPPVPAESWSTWGRIIEVGDLIFTTFFVTDVVVRIVVLQRSFWKVPLNYIDVAVSAASLFEVTVYHGTTLAVNPILFRLVRIGKLARAIRFVTMTSMLASLQLLVKCLASSSNMLFWSFCLLTFVQCVAGLIVSTLCRDFFEDDSYDVSLREAVFRYYGTFTRTFLTMFEILFANWGPACRVLVENFSEWFSIFFLFYRCVLGFAVLNVVNAVFVQQTMKTAGSDEELAFKQKEKDAQMYTRKVKRLFQTIDDSGDGTLNLEEFSKLVQSPKLKFWMSQLELEYHDLLSLFEFLDNGDGEITLMEFIEGAARLRGGAKALDIWRIETKLEVLFEEVLKALHTTSGKVMPLSVQDACLIYRHMVPVSRIERCSGLWGRCKRRVLAEMADVGWRLKNLNQLTMERINCK
ncbi:CACNA1I [Symbiodinium pilosum]|uniref:CACNA1I protein n=1 Tax=Symbiodinium pilosum TaxID=2952 RepID=A0A812U3B0_SYMPI|nr:CACNA1I [Symbiodinium pilosum]